MQKPKIEKNVPLPPGIEAKLYPWEEMEIGDSFLARGKRVRQLIHARDFAQTKYKIKVVMRQEKDGVRVWRYE